MLNDLRYAVRMLRKSPGFTTIAVLTLALGIGANAAIFSVINGVLLKPLAYRKPERIVTMLQEGLYPVAPADFLDWRAQSQSFETVAAAEAWGGILTSGGEPETILGIRFGEGMFETLGVPPLVGRTFQADDFKAGRDHVLVLGYSLWQRHFGGDPSIVGRSTTLNGESYTVIGVMPRPFRFTPFWATKSEMAAPLDLTARATQRGGNSLRVFARLKPGISLAQAQAEMNAICRRLEQAYPDTNTGRTVQVDPLLEKVVGDTRPALGVLAGAVIFVLLIASANVANLLLVRATTRHKEMAIRAALGATQRRTIRQLLTESVVLAVIAGALGLLLGYGSLEWIKGLLGGDSTSFRLRMPRVTEITVDSTTLLFTLGVALVTGLVFGLAPVLQATRPDLQDALKEGGRGTTEGRRGRRMRGGLVVAEIALALITLVGAGLLLRSFSRLMSVQPGFDPHHVISMIVSLYGQPDMIGEKREVFYRQLMEKIEHLPGVESASAINHLPLAGDIWGQGVNIEGRPLPRPGQDIGAVYRVTRPSYFQTMRISLLQGRDFSLQDGARAPAAVIISERFARQHWPNEDPIGKRITFDVSSQNPLWRTIVGIVTNAKQSSWSEAPDNEVYVPFMQSDFATDGGMHVSAMTVVVRTAANPLNAVGLLRDAVRSLNKDAAVSSVVTMEEVISNVVWAPRFNVILIGLFAGLALLLGAVGIYGVMAYAVTQRTHEIGIRMALGAGATDVLRLLLGQGVRLVFTGVILGLAGAMGLTRVMGTLLFGVSASDPMTFVAVVLILAGVALLACYVPARRATKVDPMVALRYE